MTIDFSDEKDLINQIFESDIDRFTFAILFLDRYGITLCKSSQQKIDNVESKRRNENQLFKSWLSINASNTHTLSELPDWLIKEVEHASRLSISQAAERVVKDIASDSYMHNHIATHNSILYFNHISFPFIIARFRAKHWLSMPSYNRWQSECHL